MKAASTHPAFAHSPIAACVFRFNSCPAVRSLVYNAQASVVSNQLDDSDRKGGGGGFEGGTVVARRWLGNIGYI